jgi:AcrR family transcriptional regulator
VYAHVYGDRGGELKLAHASAQTTRGGAAGDEQRRPTRRAPLSQRARLLDAIVVVVGRTGYPDASIGEIARRGRISHATFYRLFENKQACFVAAHRERADRLRAAITRAVAEHEPVRAVDVVFSALADLAEREPLTFSFLTHEAMVAGPAALDERDRLIECLEEIVDRAHEEAPGDVPLPDVPARILIGGLIRTIGIAMRSGKYDARRLCTEMIGWVDCYRVVGGADLQRSLITETRPANPRQRIAPGALAPVSLPRGRHRIAPALVERVRRERILRATAEAIHAKGYAHTTVADIAAAAGVSREIFYSHFRSRSDAFAQTLQLVFEHAMAVTAGAFFASFESWAEQIWAGGSELTGFASDTPSFAHLALFEAYALGPADAQRPDSAILAFTALLRARHDRGPQTASPPQSVLEGIVGGAMELAAFHVRQRCEAESFSPLPLGVYVALAPFVGARAARGFVVGKLDGIG